MGEWGARDASNNLEPIRIWVCLKIGYIPNYSHLIGIMIINHWVWGYTIFRHTHLEHFCNRGACCWVQDRFWRAVPPERADPCRAQLTHPGCLVKISTSEMGTQSGPHQRRKASREEKGDGRGWVSYVQPWKHGDFNSMKPIGPAWNFGLVFGGG